MPKKPPKKQAQQPTAQAVVQLARKQRHLELLTKVQQKQTLSRAELEEIEEFEQAAEKAKAPPDTGPPPGIVRTQLEVARAFGVTTRTVQYWLRDGCPRVGDNYDLLAVERWRLEQQERRQGTSAPDADSKEFWEKEYRKARTQLTELQLKQRTGELLSRDDVAAGRNQRILVIKRALLGLPARTIPALQGLEPRQQETLLADRIEEIIKEFAGQE